jgi:hypothetical protein
MIDASVSGRPVSGSIGSGVGEGDGVGLGVGDGVGPGDGVRLGVTTGPDFPPHPANAAAAMPTPDISATRLEVFIVVILTLGRTRGLEAA